TGAGTSKSSIVRVSKQFRVSAMASFDGTLRVFFIRNSNALAAQLSALNGVVILRAKSKANPQEAACALDDVLSLAHRSSAPFSNIKLIGIRGRRRWASKFRRRSSPAGGGSRPRGYQPLPKRGFDQQSRREYDIANGEQFWRYDWLRQLGSGILPSPTGTSPIGSRIRKIFLG